MTASRTLKRRILTFNKTGRTKRNDRKRKTKKDRSGSEKTVFIDESGDMGRKPGSSKTFTMTATITDKPEKLAEIANKYPKNTRYRKEIRTTMPNELKFISSDRMVRKKVLKDIAATEPRIRAVVVDKSKTKAKGKEMYIDAAKELLNDVMKDTYVKSGRGVKVIFDHHVALSENAARHEVKIIADKHKVKLSGQTLSKSSYETPELQAADFPAGAVGAGQNADNKRDLRMIRSKTKIRHIEPPKAKKR